MQHTVDGSPAREHHRRSEHDHGTTPAHSAPGGLVADTIFGLEARRPRISLVREASSSSSSSSPHSESAEAEVFSFSLGPQQEQDNSPGARRPGCPILVQTAPDIKMIVKVMMVMCIDDIDDRTLA
jgi:hypothetical protein